MAAFEAGSWVWYNHEVETWSPAKVRDGGSGMVRNHDSGSLLLLPLVPRL